ncbi:MAG: MBOAT family protein [Alphaproteobacteria bacterium]
MIFPTLSFLLFFLFVFPVSWAIRNRHETRKYFLIAASYFFYAFWDWRFAFLLLASTVVNYAGGKWVFEAHDERTRKWGVALGVAANLLFLSYFKYCEFFIQSLNDVLVSFGIQRELPIWEIILPVGISFFTFQGISYIVDCYRRDVPHAYKLTDVMLYNSFFPHLVAGPIVRAADFMPQLDRKPDPSRILVGMALVLILWGLFKKSVIANEIAIGLVDKVFFDPSRYGPVDLLLAAYGYAVQIYCDFSAYSDMAIGLAALFGYHFQRNFNQPYRAATLQDFWRRWHISLSSWLREYLYRPLGGNRGGRFKTYRNLFLTMILGGIWHGAAWNFIFWGFLHGVGLAIERALGFRLPGTRLGRALAIFVVFHFVVLCWIFFRADSFDKAWQFLAAFGNVGLPVQHAGGLVIGLIAFGLAIHFTPSDMLARSERTWGRWPALVQGTAAGALVVAIEAFGTGAAAPFIYFRF